MAKEAMARIVQWAHELHRESADGSGAGRGRRRRPPFAQGAARRIMTNSTGAGTAATRRTRMKHTGQCGSLATGTPWPHIMAPTTAPAMKH